MRNIRLLDKLNLYPEICPKDQSVSTAAGTEVDKLETK